MPDEPLAALLEKALAAREPSFDADHLCALRLFNGFHEGCPDLAVDLYARTLVLHDYAGEPGQGLALVRQAEAFFRERLPWLGCALVKTRNSPDPAERRGRLLFGAPDDRVLENGVWYALDLLLNRDLSLYLDTRELRRWARQTLGGKSVLNTFAYTGSLGVAALAGGQDASSSSTARGPSSTWRNAPAPSTASPFTSRISWPRISSPEPPASSAPASASIASSSTRRSSRRGPAAPST